MRVLLGLSALVAVANGQTVTISGANTGSFPQSFSFGNFPSVTASVTLNAAGGPAATVTPPLSGSLSTSSWSIYVPNAISAVNFAFTTNTYVGQMQYRWAPNYVNVVANNPNPPFVLNPSSYTCDTCSGGTAVSCFTSTGPGTAPSPLTGGFQCANLVRNYLFSGLQSSTPSTLVVNSFSVQIFDIQTQPGANVQSYSFAVIRQANPVIVGDPQIVGMQGQDFQVHGMPDEIFNVVSYPSLQINARFTYLESGACHDNFTACFAHPGTYISEEGFRVGRDKVRVVAGSFKKGLTVTVNGKKLHENISLKSGAVQVVSHRRVIVHTDIMKVTVSNSDHFLNQELELLDDKLVALGSTRKILKDNQRFHPEVPLHGLQGQTWRNVEYPSGLEYEGSIMDYHVVDGNLFGTDFVFNQYSS